MSSNEEEEKKIEVQDDNAYFEDILTPKYAYDPSLPQFQIKPVLNTPRLTLTPWNYDDDGDVELSLAIFRDPEFQRTDGKYPVHTKDDLGKMFKANRMHTKFFGGMNPPAPCTYVIRLGANDPNGLRIGTTGFMQRPESKQHPGKVRAPAQGWNILCEYAGHGYVTEAAREVLRYFREEVGWTETRCAMMKGHPASYRIAEKIGYRRCTPEEDEEPERDGYEFIHEKDMKIT